MCAKKTKVEIDPKDELVKELNAEIEDLQKQMKILVSENVQWEDRYNEEHKKRMHERNDASLVTAFMSKRIKYLDTQLKAAKELRAVEKDKRLASVPKFVIASAVAFALLAVPGALQKFSIIGPQLGYAIQSVLMMAISFCYAIIWDRSRKN